MGFSLDASTIREIADAVATEVIQALSRSRIPMQIDDRDLVEVGPLTVNVARREAALHGRVLDLNPRELALLTVLARNAGRALSRDQLLESDAIRSPPCGTRDLRKTRSHNRRRRGSS